MLGRVKSTMRSTPIGVSYRAGSGTVRRSINVPRWEGSWVSFEPDHSAASGVGHFFLGRELASRHFEAGQKLDIAQLVSGAALADAEFLLVCAILRPAFGQLVLGICFVLRAALGPEQSRRLPFLRCWSSENPAKNNLCGCS